MKKFDVLNVLVTNEIEMSDGEMLAIDFKNKNIETEKLKKYSNDWYTTILSNSK